MKHDPRLQRLLDALPRPARQSYAWLMRPQAKWVRLPLGFALIAGSALSFLPGPGIWMLPIGALLIGEDIPPVRRATLYVLGRLQRWWDAWRSPPKPPPPSPE
ncbi:MAG: hypothetical protein ACREFZ_04220, partial [Acetobacteraceae bacterium]